MGKLRQGERTGPASETTWLVLDDLDRLEPVTPAELDAVEAFLMPLVRGIFADGEPCADIAIPFPTGCSRSETHKGHKAAG